MASTEDALAAAHRLVDQVAAVAGPALRSAILHGSLAAGGFRPGRSDIDMLAVVDGGLSDARATAIEHVVRRADPGAAAGIDLHVVTAAVAAGPTPAPPLELYVGGSGGATAGLEIQRRVPADPDLPAELSTARAGGRAVRGAPPGEVLAPVPAAWVVDRGRHWLTVWRSRTGDTEHAAFMVLTACRTWRFATDHGHCSKAEAAAWALDRDPSLTVVAQALRQYERDPAQPVDEPGLAALLDRVLRETAGAR